MRTIELVQGSPEWHAHRARHFNASDAAAMMGASKYKTRTDLLKELATGITPETDPAAQRRFDAGHAAEAAARPIVQARLGEELFPVTGVEVVDGMHLSASFDGISMLGGIIWENKLANGDINVDDLDAHYWAQLEHQLLVSGAEKAYFTTSDGTDAGTHGAWYVSRPERRAKLIAGWKQFAEDLANYQHIASKPEPVAAAIKSLPALLVQVEGRVLATNLDAFKAAAQTFIDGIKTELVSDQDFVDADRMVKFLKDGEDRLAQAKQHALAQTASIDELFRAVDAISEQMRSKRLALGKLVEAEKQNRRAEIIRDAQDAYMAHIDKLNARIGNYMPRSVPAFAESIKGLKSLDSMHEKIGNAVRDSMFHASEIADRIEQNIKYMKAFFDNTDYSFLFPDIAQIVLKASDDFAGVVTMRVNEHKEAEYKRLEAETERIRQEEADRITRESAQAATDQRATEITASLQSQLSENGVTVEQSDMKSMLDAFLEKMVQPDRRNNIRSIIMAWEQFKAER